MSQSQQPAAAAGACAAQPRTHADAVQWTGASCHRQNGVAADATGARGPRAVVMLMIHLPLAPAHGLRTPSRLRSWLQPTAWARFEVNARSHRLTSPV